MLIDIFDARFIKLIYKILSKPCYLQSQLNVF